jgi:hypothetical protein
VQANDGVDLNGDGTEEFFAKIGAGASATVMGIFDVIDCDLVHVTVDGAPAELTIGASVGNFSGYECLDGGLDLILADGLGMTEGEPGFMEFGGEECPNSLPT